MICKIGEHNFKTVTEYPELFQCTKCGIIINLEKDIEAIPHFFTASEVFQLAIYADNTILKFGGYMDKFIDIAVKMVLVQLPAYPYSTQMLIDIWNDRDFEENNTVLEQLQELGLAKKPFESDKHLYDHGLTGLGIQVARELNEITGRGRNG